MISKISNLKNCAHFISSSRFYTLFFAAILSFNQAVYAQNDTVVEVKDAYETQADENPYAIALYQPTYILPFEYTSSFSKAAQADTPDNEKINHIETQFQFSVKVSVFKNILHYRNSLNLAYTQLSFWQIYNKSSFFRETNYQPEVFFENIFDKNLAWGWQFHSFNIGYLHDSNGRGGDLERSWNRIYADMIFSNPNWMINIRPWYVVQGESLENNKDIAKFLGYERVILAYKFYNNVIALQTYNLEHISSKASAQLTWSFPLIKQVRGYVQGFSGYGQSLIDYNHHANSISVGLALNDWL